MPMPKVNARTEVTTDPVPGQSYPDLILMQLQVQTAPKTLVKSARVVIRPYNFEKQALGPRSSAQMLHIDDLEKAAAEIPALQAAVDALGPLLGNLIIRRDVAADIKAVDVQIEQLDDEADDTALQAQRAELVAELAAVETKLGISK